MARLSVCPLKRIQKGKVEEAGEFVEGGAGFVEEGGIGEIVGAEVFAVMPVDPGAQAIVEGVREQDAGVQGVGLFLGEDDAKAEAGRPAAIAHALADIDVAHSGDCSRFFADEADRGAGAADAKVRGPRSDVGGTSW